MGAKNPFHAFGRKTIGGFARLDTDYTNRAANDVVPLFTIPANTLVTEVVANVKTAEGSVATIAIGDAASATQFIAAADVNALGATVAASTTKKFYAVATVVNAKTLAACDTAIVDVHWAGIDMGEDPTDSTTHVE